MLVRFEHTVIGRALKAGNSDPDGEGYWLYVELANGRVLAGKTEGDPISYGVLTLLVKEVDGQLCEDRTTFIDIDRVVAAWVEFV